MNALITSGSIGSMAGICTERIIVDEAISAYYGVRKSADRQSWHLLKRVCCYAAARTRRGRTPSEDS